MASPIISCNVIDRRTSLPAAGMSVILRCLQPRSENSEFQATTDSKGNVFEWLSYSVPEISLLHFFFANNYAETTTWQMEFLTTEYFAPVCSRYSVAEVNFLMHRGQQAPHITLFADVNGYGTWIEPLKNSIQQTDLNSKREYQRFSKEQNKALMEHFVDEPYPSPSTYVRLSVGRKKSSTGHHYSL